MAVFVLTQEGLTVRDLVSGVIESQLKRADLGIGAPPGIGAPAYPPGPSESPTITSILKDSQRSYALGRSSVPLTVVTNTAPTPPPRPVTLPPLEAKQGMLDVEIVRDPFSGVRITAC